MACIMEKIPVLTLDESQKEEQLATVELFLKLVHPCLMDENNKAFVELRGIARDYDGVPFPIRSTSYNTEKMSDKDHEYLQKWLDARNGFPICLYYSVFTYDRWQQSFTKTGKPAQGGKITDAAALFLEELPLDFDHISREQMEKYDAMFVDAGLAPLWVSSGHGYQCHILLNERIKEQKTLSALVNLVISKGFAEVDPVCKDRARLFRLPYSFNCKAFEKTSKYITERENPPRTEIVKLRTQRYSLCDIIAALNKIPTVDWDMYIAALSEYEESRFVSVKDEQEAPHRQMPNYPASVMQAMNLPKFPSAFVKILEWCPQGYRHDALGCLIMLFNKGLGYSAAATRDILRVWNEQACDPALDNYDMEFNSSWPGVGKYSLKKLAKQFGYMNIKEFLEEKNREEIRIPNKLLNNMGTLKNALKTYIGFEMAEHEGMSGTPKEVAALLCSDYGTVRRNAKSLVSKGFLREHQGNKSQGVPYTYSCSYIGAYSEGYLAIPYEKMKEYLASMGSADLALFLLLRQESLSSVDYVASYGSLAAKLGCTTNNISRMITRLKENGLVDIEYRYIDKVCHRNAIQLCA